MSVSKPFFNLLIFSNNTGSQDNEFQKCSELLLTPGACLPTFSAPRTLHMLPKNDGFLKHHSSNCVS
jgi:hypothetical protein